MAAMRVAGETPAYRTARDRLLEREIALRREMEAVAVQRRALPAGPPVAEDYLFEGLDDMGKPASIARDRGWRHARLFSSAGNGFKRAYRAEDADAGTIEPFWNMFDLLPAGRPDFDEQMQYACCEGSQPLEEKR